MIELAVASIPFVLFMYLILKKREHDENYARHTKNDSQDIPEGDTDTVNDIEHESTENISQERDTEVDPGQQGTTDKENLSSAASGRTDMIVLLVYYYRTIIKIIELIMSKRALRGRHSRRDNYESMIPLSRSTKECDLLAPTAKHEENNSDDTDEDQEWDEEFVMKHQEASIDNLEVFIAQRRKIETYLQQCNDKEIDSSSSETVDNSKTDIILPPPEKYKNDTEIINSDDEKSLRIESELLAAMIDEAPCSESESENIFAASSDEATYDIEAQFEKLIAEADLTENDITITASDTIFDIDHEEQILPTKERDESESDILLKESKDNYEARSEISNILIDETLNDDLENLHSESSECSEASSYVIISDDTCESGIIIGGSDALEASDIIDTNDNSISLDKDFIEQSKDYILETLKESEYRIDSKSADIILRLSDDKCEPESDISCTLIDQNVNEIFESAYIADDKSNEKINTIESKENISDKIDSLSSLATIELSIEDGTSDVKNRLDINNITRVQEFIKITEDSSHGALENLIEYEETPLNKLLGTDDLSYDSECFDNYSHEINTDSDITLKPSEDNYQGDSDISETLIPETINDDLKNLHAQSFECSEKSSYELNSDDTCTAEIIVVEDDALEASDIIDTNANSISLDKDLTEKSKYNNIETLKESEYKIDNKSADITLRESEDKCESESDVSCTLVDKIVHESLDSTYIVSDKSSKKSNNIEHEENLSNSKLSIGKDEINDTTKNQKFEKISEDSIQSTLENIDEPLNTENLSKDIDSTSNISNKKSFRNKGKRRKCTHKTVKRNKVSQNENEDEDDDESLLNEESSHLDLQDSSSEPDIKEEIQSATAESTVSLTKISGHEHVSKYMLLKEIEQVEALIRDAVNENTDLSPSFIEPLFSEENNNSESAGIFQSEDHNLEPIKEETIEETNSVSNGKDVNENPELFDNQYKDNSSFIYSETVSDDNAYKTQDIYDFKEAYAVCEYEEVAEDVYETFCDESDFMVPVIKRDDEWWATLGDKDNSQFETVGDKNTAYTNLESTTISNGNKRKKSVPKKVSFRADDELATIIVENIGKESLTEHKDDSFKNKEIYNINEVSQCPPKFEDLEMHLDNAKDYNTYGIDTYQEDITNFGLSSYKTIDNLVSVDEYDIQSKYKDVLDDSLHDTPKVCSQQEYLTETYDPLNRYQYENFDSIFFTENISLIEDLYDGDLISEKGEIMYTDENLLNNDTISTMDECQAFQAEVDDQNQYSQDAEYITGVVDESPSNFINLSNIDICTAYKAVGGSDFTEWSTFDTFYNINTLSNIEEEAEEKENEVHVQDTFLDESFLGSKNINVLKAESPAPSSNMKQREIYSGGEIYLEHKTNIHNEAEETNTHCIGNEILNERNLSSYNDEIDVELYQSTFSDRRNVLGSDKEMEIDNRVSNLDDYDSNIDKCKAFRALVSKIIELESQMEAIELDVELYQSSFKDEKNELGSDKEKEVDNRVSNLNDSKIDECKAFSAISEPCKLKDVLVSKIIELESQMKAIESYLVSSNETVDTNTSETNVLSDKPDENSVSQISVEEIPQISYVPLDVPVHKYESEDFYEVNSNYLKNENEYEYQESNISYSNIDQCKAFHVEDIAKIENQHKKISLDTYSIINSYERKYENENEENYCEMQIVSCSKIDNYKAFKVDDIEIKSTFSNINENEVLESSSISFSVIDLCKAFHAKEVQVATSEPKEVLKEYCSPSIHERQKEILDNDHFALSNLCYSTIDQCKAFSVKPIQEVTLQSKENSNDFSFPYLQEIQQESLEDCNSIEVSTICYSKIEQCKAFYAEEIQLVEPQPKEVTTEYICPSLHKIHKKRLEDDHMELSNLCYSKLDQCKAFKATTIAINNTSTIPETKTKTKKKTKTKTKKCTQPSTIGSIKHVRDLDSSTPLNLHKETTTLGEASSKMSDPVISMGSATDNNEPVVEITQVGGKAPIVTLSKEESDYVLSVKLENFKNLQLLQHASVSQDDHNHK